ncbi:MAG: hypothetical protein BGO98_47020 [Myxococcales bacterium 68-20]|nr:MAG: hypothetical protein BGO98_47020 [Myxococcales bacterium 68-20]
MALLTLSLIGCGEKANTCGVSLQDSALFTNNTAVLTGDVEAARTAALAAEGARHQEVVFAEKIAAIAKDPKASEQWATVIKLNGTEARTNAKKSGVAVDLPLQASRLRAAGVPADEVSKAIDAAISSDISVDEAAALLAISATAAEESGPIDGFGGWTAEQVKLGLRGPALARELKDEHKSRGEKARKADEASGKKATVCHRPPGNPNNAKTLEVGPSALAAHLGHGDTEGPCPEGAAKRDDKDNAGGNDKDKDKDKDKDRGNAGNDKDKGNAGGNHKGHGRR